MQHALGRGNVCQGVSARGVSAQGGGFLHLVRGVSAQGVSSRGCLLGGVSAWRGVCPGTGVFASGPGGVANYIRVHSHLRFIRCELFTLCNCEKCIE